MGFIQRFADKQLLARAVYGKPGVSFLSDRMLWGMSGKSPDQLGKELRSSLENPQTPLSYPAEWLLDIFNGGRTDSGIRVSEMTALQTDAVLACVKIISNAIASLPLHVYQRQMKGARLAKSIALDHPLYHLLRIRPNPEMTKHTFIVTMLVHALLWGNAYCEIQRDNGNRVVALWPRNPARTRPARLTRDMKIEGTVYEAGTLMYHTSETLGDEQMTAEDNNGNRMAPERVILAEDMIHVVGLTLDGRLGQSIVYLARQIIGLALASEKYGAKFFGNGAVPRGVLTIPAALEPKAMEQLRRSWQEAYGGENAGKTAILEQGVDYKPIGSDPEKSQLLATREYQRKSIAAIFNVPPHMIGEGESSKSTTEQTAIEFLTFCLTSWINPLEEEFKVKLFPIDDPKQAAFFCKFDTHSLRYPNSDSRAKFYDSGKQWGWLNTNDIHELEDMNPVEDESGEVYYIGVNMQDAANPMTMPHIGGKQNEFDNTPNVELPLGGAPQNKKTPPAKASLITRFTRVYYPMFRDAAGRIVHRREVDETNFKRCFMPAMNAMIEALSHELAGAEAAIPASSFTEQLYAYMEGMRFNLQGIEASDTEKYAISEVRRAIESWHTIVGRRYNPNHSQQPRHPDGTFHDGSTDFFIGRHGTTDEDTKGVWSGWNDIKLNAQGRDEVAQTAQKLKGLGIKRIVSSELPRCLESAQMYANVLGVPMSTDARLNALNIGELAGLDEKVHCDRLQLYIDNPDVPIPGGETVRGYQQRVNDCFDELQSNNESTGPILVMTHSSGAAVRIGRIRSGGDGLENLEACSELLSPAGVVQINGKKIQTIAGVLSQGDAA
jgi:HK97 family phage portal protein